jgi:hypothetical protein
LTAQGQPEWQQAYQAALLEVDPAKLRDRIVRAYAAIEAYRADASKRHLDMDDQALSDALSNLRALRREAGLPANDLGEKGPEPPAPDLQSEQ